MMVVTSLAASREGLAAARELVDSGFPRQATSRVDADYGESTISVDEASDSIAKAEHIVDVVEHAIAGGLGSRPSS
jgi:uncharacterized protein (UPF0332 family)